MVHEPQTDTMTKEDYILEYKKVLTIRRLAQATIEAYVSCLKMFLNWCEEADIFPPNLIKTQLTDYLSHTESASLLRQQIGTISNFYEFVLGIPHITAGIPYPKKEQSLPDYFSPQELMQIFDAVKNDKQRLILKIQYALALRVHEVVKIKWSDFIKNYSHELGIDVYEVKIKGKGGQVSMLPVYPETINEIIQVLGDKFGISEYLFKGQFKDFYSTRSVQMIINRAMDECKILKDGSTHLLRHSRATHLLQNGSSLRHVQMLLRHKKSTTTEIYTHLNTVDLRSSFMQSDNKMQQAINKQKLLK